jgi:hypothetical protein
MRFLRRLAPALSFLLVALIGVQMLDLVECADEAVAADSTRGTHVDAVAAVGAHPSPASGQQHDDEAPHEDAGVGADCLCHVVFTPVDHLPEVASVPATEPASYVAHLDSRGGVYARPAEHVPLS